MESCIATVMSSSSPAISGIFVVSSLGVLAAIEPLLLGALGVAELLWEEALRAPLLCRIELIGEVA